MNTKQTFMSNSTARTTENAEMNSSTDQKSDRQAKNIESYDIANSYETMHLAQDLARFIKENKLFHHIQGKAYVNVEGWQYAGARLGILPVIDDLVNISLDASEIKYQAKVRLLNLRSQQTVGSGFAICSNRENGKRNYQEFAIASMAQTRAIGKAYRNILAWIIRAAGYEPTPAEEMDYMSDRTSNEGSSSGSRASDASSRKQTENASAKTKKIVSKNTQSGGNKEDNSEKNEEVVKKMATVKQKTELLLLLNNKAIKNEEKNKMIEGINNLDTLRATKAIQKIKKVIEERERENDNINTHAA